jgi:tetratricopeptide (TPR) repeat protein
MAAIFISHSSNDNAQAVALKNMLSKIGFENVFLDFDKREGIRLGSDWERKLYYELARCHAVLLILTRNWLESKWCFAEFTQARAMGKTVYVVLENPAGQPNDIAKDIQVCDLITNREIGLQRLHHELESALLIAQAGFAFDERTRAPYPGLNAFEEIDAAVFFGRDEEVSAVLERMRSERGRSKKALVLLGGSGTGKSSLLKAGAVPRLRRERDIDGKPIYLIATLRPGRTPLRALFEAMRSLDPSLTISDIRVVTTPKAAWEMVDRLRTKAASPTGVLVLAIDQAEEMFTAEPDERAAFEGLLAALVAGDNPARLLLSMRADHVEEAQRVAGLGDALDFYAVKPMPLERLREIVKGPAKRVDMTVDDDLLEAIRSDAATQDALPLVAFVLREVYERYGRKSRRLERSHYEAMRLGDLSPLESAVRRRVEETIRDASEAELKALRKAFVPGLVRLDEERSSFTRRDARLDDLPPESRGLIEKLINARLLMQRASVDGTRVEVAHEALFRVWPTLATWLAEDRDLLASFQGVQRAAKEWSAHDRKDAWLAHRGLRLHEAEDLVRRADIAGKLDPLDSGYLSECRRREDAMAGEVEARHREREEENARRLHSAETLAAANRRIARRTGVGLVAALALAGVAGWQWRDASRQFNRAENILTESTGAANAMVFDLASELRNRTWMPIDLVGTILGRAHEIQKRLVGEGENRPDLLLGEAKGLNEIVLTEFPIGDTKNALAAAEDFVKIMTDLVKRDSANPEWRRFLSFSYNRRGDALLKLGRRREALGDFIASVAVREDLANNRSDFQAQADLAAAYEKLGQAQHAIGGDDLNIAADKSYERALAIREGLVVAQPKDRDRRRDLSLSYENRGGLEEDLGEDDTALRFFQLCLDTRQKLVAEFPDDTELRRDLAIADDRIALVLKRQDRVGESLEKLATSLNLRQTIASSDPMNREWQRDLAVGMAHFGDLLALRGDRQGSLERYHSSLAIRERLAATDPNNPNWQIDLVLDLRRLAELGDDPRQKLTRALDIARRLAAEGRLPAELADWPNAIEKKLAADTP